MQIIHPVFLILKETNELVLSPLLQYKHESDCVTCWDTVIQILWMLLSVNCESFTKWYTNSNIQIIWFLLLLLLILVLCS